MAFSSPITTTNFRARLLRLLAGSMALSFLLKYQRPLEQSVSSMGAFRVSKLCKGMSLLSLQILVIECSGIPQVA